MRNPKYVVHDSLEGRDTVAESRLVEGAGKAAIAEHELRRGRKAQPFEITNIKRACALWVFNHCRFGGDLPTFDSTQVRGLSQANA